jgi:hypothetical protein
MIISASRRTDIPNHHAAWFFSRITEGAAIVRNPFNPQQERRISLKPEAVDGIVFWTKNPLPMQGQLHRLQDYAYYFQFSVTAYGADIEPGIPDKETVIIPAFARLADQIGPERVIWRYDPILINAEYSLDDHRRAFDRIARRLHRHTRRCTISFLDTDYRGVRRNLKSLTEITPELQLKLGRELAAIAQDCGLAIEACAEPADLGSCGIRPAHCVDASLFEKMLNRPLNVKKDKNQRPACGCASSVDIGQYNTCPNGCLYCYANYNRKRRAD